MDLPRASQRAEILEIHLRKRGLDPAQFDLTQLVAASNGFSGAEIEQGIVSALYAAHAVRQKPGLQHVLAELRKTRPLAVLMREKIEGLREWAVTRTVPAD